MDMRKLIAASVIGAVGLVSSQAEALSDHQRQTLEIVFKAAFAGTQDNCPRFRLRNRDVGQELLSVGITEDDLKTNEVQDIQNQLFAKTALKWAQNPSDFCNAAWQLFGPHGMYFRQLLEEK
jgi:hypothetical protein